MINVHCFVMWHLPYLEARWKRQHRSIWIYAFIYFKYLWRTAMFKTCAVKPNVSMFPIGSDIEKQLPVINKENWFSRKGRSAACVFSILPFTGAYILSHPKASRPIQYLRFPQQTHKYFKKNSPLPWAVIIRPSVVQVIANAAYIQ